MPRITFLTTLVAFSAVNCMFGEEPSPRATAGATSRFEALLERLAPKLDVGGSVNRADGPANEHQPTNPAPGLFTVAPFVAPELLGTSIEGWGVWFDPPLTETWAGGLLPLAAEGPSAEEIIREAKGMVAPHEMPQWNRRLDLIATPPPDRPLRLEGIDWPGPEKRLPQRK